VDATSRTDGSNSNGDSGKSDAGTEAGNGSSHDAAVDAPDSGRWCTTHPEALFCADFDMTDDRMSPPDGPPPDWEWASGGDYVGCLFESEPWMRQVAPPTFKPPSPPYVFETSCIYTGWRNLQYTKAIQLVNGAAHVSLWWEDATAIDLYSDFQILELQFAGSDYYQVRLNGNGISIWVSTDGANYQPAVGDAGVASSYIDISTQNGATTVTGLGLVTQLSKPSNSFVLVLGPKVIKNTDGGGVQKLRFDNVLVTP
jgi:hypothetical protein